MRVIAILCVARAVRPEERKVLDKLFADELARLAKDAEAVRKVGGSAALAALKSVAMVLLNMDETLTRN